MRCFERVARRDAVDADETTRQTTTRYFVLAIVHLRSPFLTHWRAAERRTSVPSRCSGRDLRCVRSARLSSCWSPRVRSRAPPPESSFRWPPSWLREMSPASNSRECRRSTAAFNSSGRYWDRPSVDCSSTQADGRQCSGSTSPCVPPSRAPERSSQGRNPPDTPARSTSSDCSPVPRPQSAPCRPSPLCRRTIRSGGYGSSHSH